jgi:hypothetical protein
MSSRDDNSGRHDRDRVEPLPDRTLLSLVPMLPTPLDTSSLAGFVQNAGVVSGNAEQTAPIAQGLASAPALPIQ